jgi:hypothetical protein
MEGMVKIGPYQQEILQAHIEHRREGWQTKFRIGKFRPYTREFGTGWPIYIITSAPDNKLRMRNQLSLLRNRSGCYSRIDDFKRYIEESEK